MRTTARWVMQHGVVRFAARRAARQGDLHALFMRDDRYRPDPFPFYEAVRRRGRIVRGRLVSVTVSYDVISEVLRSDDWRAGSDEGVLPPPFPRVPRRAPGSPPPRPGAPPPNP